MNGLTVKLDSAQSDWLGKQAETRGCSKAVILRDLIDQQRAASSGQSLHDRLHDLCGSLAGSKDLSTRKLKGYGRSQGG